MHKFMQRDSPLSVEEYIKLIKSLDLEAHDETVIERDLNIVDCPKSDIGDLIRSNKHLYINNFLVIVYYMNDQNISLCLFEKQTHTISGFPCKMETKINISKDNRFDNNIITSVFDIYNNADVNIDQAIEVVKYIQMLCKYGAVL